MLYKAELTGTINDEEILVEGEGTIIEGITEGDYSLIKIPAVFDPEILEALLITGYPNACKSLDGSANIFKGKSYTYKRKLSFNNGGLLEMQANCRLEGDTLFSTFNVKGKLAEKEPIENAEPIIEIWQPTSENYLSGLFRVTWKTKSGKYLSADAASEYKPGGVSNELPVLHRYIEIKAKVTGNRLALRQSSMLFQKMNNS